MPPPRPSFTLVFVLSLAAHIALFTLVVLPRGAALPHGAATNALAVKILVEEPRVIERDPLASERLREERQAWTPREAVVYPIRVHSAPTRAARAPAGARPPAGFEPAGGPAVERVALRPATLVPSLSPPPPAAMKHLSAAPESSIHEEVRAEPPAAQPAAGSKPAGGPQAQRLEPLAEKPRGVELGNARASFLTQVKPVYPRYCRIHGEEGTVVLEVEIGANGKVERVSVVESSGYGRLDAAAVDALRAASCRPAMRDGQPVLSSKRVAIVFRLRDTEPGGDSE